MVFSSSQIRRHPQGTTGGHPWPLSPLAPLGGCSLSAILAVRPAMKVAVSRYLPTTVLMHDWSDPDSDDEQSDDE